MRIKKKKSSMAAVSIIVISLLIMISMALIVRMYFLQKTEVTGNVTESAGQELFTDIVDEVKRKVVITENGEKKSKEDKVNVYSENQKSSDLESELTELKQLLDLYE
mgnify:FL=1